MLISAISINQLSSGQWVELIRIPLEKPQEMNEDVQKTIEDIKDLFYENNKVHLSVQGEAISVTQIDKNQTTFKIIGV